MPTATSTPAWRLRTRELTLERPCVMGIVNVTPDSFSDGGLWFGAEAAIAHGLALLEEGADILDVGGESTRPQGATPVAAREELERVLPVIRGLRERAPGATISVDTVKSDVAREAVAAGAEIVNDVSGLRLDAAMGATCAALGVGVVLMHSRGGVSDMATFAHAQYDDVVDDVVRELGERLAAARASGIADECVVLDPGIGFAKRSEHSLALLAAIPRIEALGRPVLVGASRKRFVGELSHEAEPARRVYGTVAAHVVALTRGARLFRVHDVRAARQSLDVAWAVLQAGAAPEVAVG